MKVVITLSDQQLDVLRAIAERLEPGLPVEQLVARAFDEYCHDHPEITGPADVR